MLLLLGGLLVQSAMLYAPEPLAREAAPPTLTPTEPSVHIMPTEPAGLQGTVANTPTREPTIIPAPLTVSTPTPAPLPSASPVPVATPGIISYRELDSYQKFGQRWRTILVPPDTDIHSLVMLAQQLHQENPTVRYRFFDDDSRYEQYMEWYLDYPDARVDYPEEWVDAHHTAVMNYMIRPADGSKRWLLTTPYGEIIAELGG
jgi:hypothetical protein